jgi:hypothetical protein
MPTQAELLGRDLYEVEAQLYHMHMFEAQDNYQRVCRELKESKAEVGRLLAEMDRPKHETLRQLADAVERNEHLKAEVEQLRGVLSAVEHVLIQHGVSSSLAVQRLIDDVNTALGGEVIVVCPGCITLEADSERLTETLAEVERLRGERDIALAVSLGGRLCISEQHKLLEAEVERLRGLILAAKDDLDNDRACFGAAWVVEARALRVEWEK